jgi:hypothetical protein
VTAIKSLPRRFGGRQEVLCPHGKFASRIPFPAFPPGQCALVDAEPKCRFLLRDPQQMVTNRFQFFWCGIGAAGGITRQADSAAPSVLSTAKALGDSGTYTATCNLIPSSLAFDGRDY